MYRGLCVTALGYLGLSVAANINHVEVRVAHCILYGCKRSSYPTTDKTNLVWEKIGKGLTETGKDTAAYTRMFIVQTNK
jgi:hypothetical protein